MRLDYKNWNYVEFYLCGIFLLPLKIPLGLIGATISYLAARIKLLLPDTPLTRKLFYFISGVGSRIILFSAGFYLIKKIKKKISDFLPNYQEIQNIKKMKKMRNCVQIAPILVSNHVTWIDFFYFLSTREAICYLAKD